MKKIRYLQIIALQLAIIAAGTWWYALSAPQSAQIAKAQRVYEWGESATFSINGKSITLYEGIATSSIPRLDLVFTTRYVGHEAVGDLNGDGRADKAFVVSQSTGKSGVFYYVIAAIKKGDSYKTTNAYYIGDRIMLQNLSIEDGELDADFLHKKPSDPADAQPSVPATFVMHVSGGHLAGYLQATGRSLSKAN